MIDRRLAFRLTERTERVTSARGLTWSGHAEPGRVDRGSQQEEGGDLGGTADAGAAPTVAAAHQVRTLRSPSGGVGVVGPPLSGGGAPRYAHPGSAAGSGHARLGVCRCPVAAVSSPQLPPEDSSRGLRCPTPDRAINMEFADSASTEADVAMAGFCHGRRDIRAPEQLRSDVDRRWGIVSVDPGGPSFSFKARSGDRVSDEERAPLVESAATIWSTLAYRQGLGPIRFGHGGFRNRLQSGQTTNSRPPSRVAFPSIGCRTARPSFVGASHSGRKTTCK